jgi:hypothetical protein
MKWLGLFVAVSMLVACGGSTDSRGSGGSGASGGGATGGSGGSGGSTGGSGGSSGGTGGTSPSGCPAAATPGAACTTPNLRCTYGDEVRPECRQDWLCLNGTWTTTKSICLEPPAGTCSSTPPTVGAVCDTEAAVCDFPDGTLCLCSSCSAGPCAAPPPKWQCAPPPSTAGCPALVPNDGSACSTEGTECQYGNPCGPSGAVVHCTNGAWKWQTDIACPA